ncbi:MAG: bifunctional 4-hydroxy-2-oxoglutarate aldolase/2-dehydro-3-deoxy-phosphogluconate aldolase [Oscillospiraceae bacterium]|nr:bifunctional 4-hydroxy-2-oxoglutarate aldolase/2-dehydro-3-deoxy-phosphogluconate aldolase [Oscillospiraceae bacterium]
MREEIIQKILEEKVIAIVRGVYGEDCVNLAKALHRGGVKLMEVTFDQKSAQERQKTADTIRLLQETLGGEMAFGAGTVTTVEMVQQAKEAGARFIISPDTDKDVIKATVAMDMVSIPGALTPTEMMQAHRAGADFVKVFPANQVGPAYFKTVAAPLSHVRMLAVGGVDGSNVVAYMQAGAVGAGVAGCLFKPQWVKDGQFDAITQATADFMATLQKG